MLYRTGLAVQFSGYGIQAHSRAILSRTGQNEQYEGLNIWVDKVPFETNQRRLRLSNQRGKNMSVGGLRGTTPIHGGIRRT